MQQRPTANRMMAVKMLKITHNKFSPSKNKDQPETKIIFAENDFCLQISCILLIKREHTVQAFGIPGEGNLETGMRESDSFLGFQENKSTRVTSRSS